MAINFKNINNGNKITLHSSYNFSSQAMCQRPDRHVDNGQD